MGPEGARGKDSPHFAVDTSFGAGMPEVIVMREAIKSGTKTYLYWYEKAQNAEDNHAYNPEDPTDLPEIACIFPDGTSANYDALLSASQNPVRVEIRNKMRGGVGMDPYDMADLAHRSGEGTKGQHGRGSKVADTAALLEECITGVDYLSKTVDANGRPYSWEGTGSVRILQEGKEEDDHPQIQKIPRFVIDLNILSRDVDQTVVGVDRPNDNLVRGLAALGHNFLSANPSYEQCKFKTEVVRKIPNLLTVFATGEPVSAASPKSAYFSKKELETIGIQPVTLRDGGDLPRVEILPNALIGRSESEGTTRSVFEGGLRLASGYSGYALNWSFYGFSQAEHGYNPGRSTDSTRLTGASYNLMALVLKNCNSSEVFEKILQVSVVQSKRCEEANIDAAVFFDGIPDATRVALKQAWRSIADDPAIAGDICVTNNETVRKRVEEEGKKVVFVQSEVVARMLTEIVGLKKAEDAVGIREVPVETPGLIEKTRYEQSSHVTTALSELIIHSRIAEGSFCSNNNNELRVSFASEDLRNFAGQYGDLPAGIRVFVEEYLLAGGRCSVIVNDTLFEFEVRSGREKNIVHIKPKKGKVARRNEDGLEVQLQPENAIRSPVFTQVKEGMQSEYGAYTNTDGSVDWKRYYAEKLTVKEALDLQLERQRRELDALAIAKEREKEKAREGKVKRYELARSIKEKLSWGNAVRVLAAAGIMGGFHVVASETAPIVVQNLPPPVVRAMRQVVVNIPGIEYIASFVGREQRMVTAGGVVIPDFENRLPDKLSADAEAPQPLEVADILQLPQKYFRGTKEEFVGYFPIENFLNTDNKGLGAHREFMRPFDHIKTVGSIDNAVKTLAVTPNQLVYKPRFKYQSLYPPVGWKITQIYKVGGADPLTNASGALYWKNDSELPKDMIIVADKVDEELPLTPALSDRIVVYKGISPVGEYQPNFDVTKASDVNSRLSGDSALQTIHKTTVDQMALAGQDSDAVSRTIIEGLNKLAFYSDGRHYGFNFQIDKQGTGYDALISVADNPKERYFCSVASNVAAEWLKSMGVRASTVPGNVLYNINGVMMADVAHQTTRAYLPNGDLLEIDLTPNITSQTDQRDSEWLRNAHSFAMEAKVDRQDRTELWNAIKDTAEKTALPISVIALSLFALKKAYPSLREREIRRRIESTVRQNSIAPIEQLLVASVANKLGTDPNSGDEREISHYVELLSKFDMKKHGLALQWLSQEEAGKKFVFSDQEISDPRMIFAKLALAYSKNERDVVDRFDPSLRQVFLDTARKMGYSSLALDTLNKNDLFFIDTPPEEFLYIYELLRLVHTGGEGTNPDPQSSVDLLARQIESKVESDVILGEKRRLLSAMYQEFTGKKLVTKIDRETRSRKRRK